MDVCSSILFTLVNMKEEMFVNVTTSLIAWGKAQTVINFCQEMISLMKDDLMTANFAIDPLKNALKTF